VAADPGAKVLKIVAVKAYVGGERHRRRRCAARERFGRSDVTSKINGYENRPVQVGTDKAVSRTRDADAKASSAAAGAEASPVQITEQARQLAALERAVQNLPVVDEARVAAIRLAIEEGRYEVSPERIADKLMRMEHELRGAEKK
jgi:negative regulator of flagellin synthesis FlgM